MSIYVYHNPDTDFFKGNLTHVLLMNADNLVAIVDTDDLDVAFQKTNSIENGWWLNTSGFIAILKTKTRSTSVGDFMYCNSTKKWFMVAPVGFTEAPIEKYGKEIRKILAEERKNK